jgi:TetR/AcrR family transcriptional repressor of nem operon
MPRVRDPKRTRRKVLQASYREFYRNGFQGGSLNRIVASAGITKGALFHHFSGKNELGYAVLEEFLAPAVHHWWVEPLLETEDPVPILQTIMERFLKKIKEEVPERGFLFNGCPICNFAVEMSPLDEGFRSRLETIYDGWRKAIKEALARGQKAGTVRADAIPEEEATFIVASVAGTSSTGKVSQEIKLFQDCIRVVMRHLAHLLPTE